MPSLNPDFIAELEKVVPPEGVEPFVRSIGREPRVSIRRNPLKPYAGVPEGTPVEWCVQGVQLPQRILFTLDPLFHAGAYYVQESSSMFLEQVFERIVFPEKGRALRVLDLCAAPGGKSTHIASLIGDEGLLVANETIRSRAVVLQENIQKWGSANVVVTGNDPACFGAQGALFDVVLVDAPCSGEGMFRKNEKAAEEWSPGAVRLCRSRQQRIVADAWDALREDGYLIYSTCTFNRQENEDNVRWIETELGGEAVTGCLPLYGKVIGSDKGYRFHPDRVDGEGFFVSVIRKTAPEGKKLKINKLRPLPAAEERTVAGWFGKEFRLVSRDGSLFAVPARYAAEITLLCEKLQVLTMGCEVGEMLHGKLKPAHALAMFHGVGATDLPRVDLPLEAVQEYLRKGNVDAAPFREGYNLVTYEGCPVGFVKRIGGRVNNLYPKEWRILFL